MRFRNRSEAGRFLGRVLESYKDRQDVLVLALPRGGVPVAYEVAQSLNAPLDIFLVRKLGVPGQEELAMGAIASGGIRTLNNSIVQQLNIPTAAIEAATRRESQELERREQLYRGDKPAMDISGHTVIVVDDGLATGSTMRVAVAALRRQNPAKIVVAVPTAAAETCRDLREEADEVVCAVTPEPFYAVGLWYEDFSQTTDEEVTELIHRAA
jgi:putative phosphoribosyl transferase